MMTVTFRPLKTAPSTLSGAFRRRRSLKRANSCVYIFFKQTYQVYMNQEEYLDKDMYMCIYIYVIKCIYVYDMY